MEWLKFLMRLPMAILTPRYAAIDAEHRAAVAMRDVIEHIAERHAAERLLGEVRATLAMRVADIESLAAERDAAEARASRMSAQMAVLQDQMGLLIQWREAELERLKTEAAIHAMRRGLDGGEPKQQEGE